MLEIKEHAEVTVTGRELVRELFGHVGAIMIFTIEYSKIYPKKSIIIKKFF